MNNQATIIQQFIGTSYITEMEGWDTDYINLVVPGYLRVDRDGQGLMQFSAVEVDLDCRLEISGKKPRLEFTFQGCDEGDAVSGRGWATVSTENMTGRIYFHLGDESGFTASREK